MDTFKRISLASILSYIAIILNTLSVLFIAPFIIRMVGASDYGVYKIIASFTTALGVLDFGIGRTATRFSARYDAENKQEKIDEVFSQTIKLILIVNVIVLILGALIYPFFIKLYSSSLTERELILTGQMYWIAILELVIVMLDNGITGILGGTDHYVIVKFIVLVSILAKLISTYVFLNLFKTVVVLSFIDFGAAILRFLLGLILVIRVSRVRWIKTNDRALLISMLSYTGVMFLETILDRVNSSADNIIIGAIEGSKNIAAYSFGIQIYSMFWQISVAISTVMLPVMTRMVVNKATNLQMENVIIRAGKVQYMMLGAIDTAFFIFGKDFIKLWLGEDFIDVWIITVVLILSSTIPAIENVTISILRARNIMGTKVALQFVGVILNVISTCILVYYFNYRFAAYTTAAVTVLVTVVGVNIYYIKKLGLNMVRVLFNIMDRTTACLVVAGITSWIITKGIRLSWGGFLGKCTIFLTIYALLMMLYGISQADKDYYLNKVKGR